jgi:hypothetical protein
LTPAIPLGKAQPSNIIGIAEVEPGDHAGWSSTFGR